MKGTPEERSSPLIPTLILARQRKKNATVGISGARATSSFHSLLVPTSSLLGTPGQRQGDAPVR